MQCLNNRRLLVVDDQEVIHFSFRTVFSSPLAAAGAGEAGIETYQVDYATSGEAALNIVREAAGADEPHALAFVDMYMPQGWDGVETITRLWEVAPDLQVVLCTAFTDYSWSQVIMRLGKTDQLLILKKPFDKFEVSQLARALTEKWRLSRQLRLQLASLEDVVAARTGELERANARLVDLNHDLVIVRDAAESASRAKTEFLANISHEIRTPMTSILGYAELLGEPGCQTAERLELVGTIRRNADHLLAIIDDLLDISKLEAGNLTIEREKFSPRELALKVISLLHMRAEEKNLRLAVEFQSRSPAHNRQRFRAAPADSAESGRERDQVHRRRRRSAVSESARRRGRARFVCSVRHRRHRGRYLPRADREPVRLLQPGRFVGDTPLQGHWPGTGGVFAAGQNPGGRHHGDERTGRGEYVSRRRAGRAGWCASHYRDR